MHILVRADASRAIGAGHAMRCLCLADRLAGAGHAVTFLTCPAEGDLIAKIRAHGHDVLALEPSRDEVEDAEACLHRIGGRSVDWIVVDHYGLGTVWERRIRARAGAIMAIDDLGRPHAADLVLDQNLANPLHDGYATVTGRALLGPRYALLRPAFAEARAGSLARRDGHVGRVLVSFGGSDPTDQTPAALRALASLGRDDLAVDAVIGRANANRAAVEALCRAMPRAVLHVQRPDMETLIAAADLAIGAGGTSVWERCALGCPALVVVVAQNQAALAEAAADAGAAINLGWHAQIRPDDIAARVRALAPDALVRMSARAAAVCDGFGVERVVGEMGVS